MKIITTIAKALTLVIGLNFSSVIAQNISMSQPSSCVASPESVILTQPNGTVITVVGKGNLNNHWTETIDGYSVVKNANGIYEYANKQNGKLVPGGVFASNPQNRNLLESTYIASLSKSLKPDINPLKSSILNQVNAHLQSKSYPTSGNIKVLALLIDYPGLNSIKPKADFDSLLAGINYRNGDGSFKVFYETTSGGQLTVDVDVKGWYRAANNFQYYAADSGYDRAADLVREAVDAAELAGTNFAQYDNNSDGHVDGVLAVHSGPGAEIGSQTGLYIWSHRWVLNGGNSGSVVYDGVRINDYMINPETRSSSNSNISGIGVFCHEFGHNLGLPDLYDTDQSNGNSEGIGNWCLMAGGSYSGSSNRPSNFSAWCKEELGWDTPQVITIGQTGIYSLNPSSTSRNEILRVNTQLNNEYFLLENRQLVGRDSDLPGTGLAIWHINTTKTNATGNSVNADETMKGVDLEAADGNNDLDNEVNRGDGGDLFPGTSNNTTFNDTTNPSAETYTLANTNFQIRNVVENGGVLSFDFGRAPGPPCAASTTLTSNTGTFDDGSGAGLDYVNNQSCAWLINPPAGTITISFSQFRTEAVNDTLTIYDGMNASAPLVGSYSGTTIPNNFTSSSNSLYVTFNTNATVSDSGFTASYITNIATPCSGTTTLTTASGNFSDGSGTSNYNNNQNCSWLIQPAGAASITFGLTNLATEINNDKITVYDGPSNASPVLGSFSGTNNLNTLTSTTGSIFVEFTTNGSITDQGFDAYYTSSTSSAGCSGSTTFTANSGTFSDGSMSNNYNNNQFCSWLIQPTSGTVTLSFTAFATEATFDRVLVYDGSNNSAPQVGNFSGSTIPSSITSTSNSLYLEFITNGSVTDAGWDASYTTNLASAACSGTTTITTNSGSFTDGSLASANYADNSNCSWLIQPTASNVLINLTFKRFATEAVNDTVTIYDGSTTSAPILATISGANPTIPNILSSGGNLLVTFNTNGSIQDTGWEADFTTQSSAACSASPTIFTGFTGTFNDGSAATSNYQNNQNCQWLIQPTGAARILLDFNRFQTETAFDFVYVYDGNSTAASQVPGSPFSGPTVPSQIISTGGSLFLVFTSDNSVTAPGWEVSYAASATQCFNNLSLTATSGNIRDGSSTNNYQDNLNCSWIIQPPRASTITASFNSFDVSSPGDTLYFYDGNSNAATLLGSFTGSTLPPNVVANSGEMYVEFITDGTTNSSGWDFNYNAVIPPTCTGTTNLTASSGTFEDGSGAFTYDNNLSCEWLIQPSGSPAVITLTMTMLDLAFGGGFPTDRVQIYDNAAGTGFPIRTFTGTFNANPVLSYTGTMLVRFTTNNTTTAQGFTADYNSSSTYCVPQTTFTANTGNFTDGSPFGQNYLDNTDCSWLIQPSASNLAVNLRFFQFDTELGNDTVTVYDGATTSSPILATLSGNNPAIPTLLSSGGSMLVTFKTNGSTVATGWRAFYNTQQIPACSGTTTLTATTGTFDDGTNSATNYAPNLNCSWLIQPTGASLVTLNFNRFSTQATFDFVTVYDGPNATSPIIGTYSGTNLPSAINSSGSSLFVEFTTNNGVQSTGWEATYNSTNNQCYSNLSITTYSGTIEDGSGTMNYQDNLNCSWLIEPPLATSITATFNNFTVAAGDTLYFYDGNSSSSTLLAAYSGTTLPAAVSSSGSNLFVEFVTDGSTNTAGWEFNYTTTLSTTCAGTTTFTAPSMTFTDGSAATANYDNNLNCSWLIQPPGNPSVIVFNMNRLNLANFNDRVRVYDNATGSGFPIRTYFGTNLGTPVSSYTGVMFIEFVTDNSSTSTGWEGTYSSSSTFCIPNTTFNANFGNFTDGSPNGVNYANNTSCEWLINPTPTNLAVQLRFTRFDTETTSDTVSVYDGATTSAPLLGTFSGNSIPPILTSSGNNMLVTFKTNSSITANGWQAIYQTQPIPYCSGQTTLNTATGTFDDGSGPTNNYVQNSNCTWLIAPTGALSIALNFNNFTTQVNADIVNVYDGSSNTDPLLGSFSGNRIPPTLNSTGGTMLVEFISDNFNNAAGWEVSYTSSNSAILQASVDTIYLNAGAGSVASFSLNSNVNWTNSDNAAWLVATPVNGSGIATINLLAIQANIGPERSGLLFINSTNSSAKDTVVVIQRTSGRFISASPDTLYFAATAAPSQTFNLVSNVSWTLSPNMSWITPSPLSGSNNANPTVSVQNNTVNQIRMGYLVISGNLGAANDTVWVVQDSTGALPPTLSVNPMSITLAQPMGSADQFTVNSTTTWQSTAGASWITVTNPTNTVDTGIVQISANSANLNPLPRASFVAVQDVSGSLLDTVFVFQSGILPILVGNPDTILLSSTSGSTATLNIISTASWTAVEGDPWFSLNQNSGSGLSMVAVTSNSANTTGALKTSYVALEDAVNNLTDTVVVIQDTSVIGLQANPDTVRIAAAAGNSGTFTISTNLGWTATPDATWLTVNPTNGTGSNSVTVSGSTNPSTNERITFVEVISTSASVVRDTVWVIQDGIVLNLDVTPTAINLNFSSGSSATVNLTSNTTWTVSNPASWLTVTPLNGMNDANLTITANSNNLTGSARTATIMVDGVGAASKTIQVNQVDGSIPSFEVSADTVFIANPQGSTGSFDVLSNVNSWTVSENTDWLLINPTSGSLTQTITALVATRNVTGNTRFANVTVSSAGFTSKTVVIAQRGATPQFTISPDSILVGADSADFTKFNLSSNLIAWQIVETASWLELSPQSGSFSQRITATAIERNNTGAQRSTIATVVAPPLVPINIKIVQDTIRTIGISERDFGKSLSVYPNPTTGIITIEIGTEYNGKMVEAKLYNAIGEEIPVAIDFRNNSSVMINLNNQSNGIYFLRVNYQGEVISRKVALFR